LALPSFYTDAVVLLGGTVIAAPLFKRFGLATVLGYLAAGVIIGPVTRLMGDAEEVLHVSELGVVMLLFVIGLELKPSRLWEMRFDIFGMGATQVVLTGLVLTALGALLLDGPGQYVVAGFGFALSSTAFVMQMLEASGDTNRAFGRKAFSILLFQDLAIVPLLALLPLLAGGSGAGMGWTGAAAGVAAIAVVVLAGRYLINPLFHLIASTGAREAMIAAALLIVVGSATLMATAGLSMALGAFLAGVLLADSNYRHELEADIEPFFFLSVGIGLNLSLLAARPLEVLGLAAGLLLAKGAVIFFLARMMRFSVLASAEIALPLAAGGEFAFVILDQAMGLAVVPRDVGQMVVVAATLTMALVPALAWLGRRIARGEPPPAPEERPAAPEDGTAPGVLVVGYGRVGQLVGDMLSRHGTRWVAAERDARLVDQARRAGQQCFFGDASRGEFLRRCGLDEVRALVVTMDDPEGVETVVAVARRLRPDLAIVARARDARHAKRLYDLGATDAVPETVEASLQLSETVLVEIGVPMGLVIASLHERRDEYRQDLNRPDALGGRTRRARR